MAIHLMRLVGSLICLISSNVWAGRPFFTDDAALTTPQTCQIETWMQLNANHDRELWALPACNPSGKFEWTVGFNQLQTHANHVDSYILQSKTLFRELETNHWGIGLAFGIIRPRHGDAGLDFIYLPYSASFADDAFVVHANVGWVKNRALNISHANRLNRMTWGLGSEYRLVNRVSVFAEAFGDDVVRPIIHTGFNISLIPDRLNLNITGGRDLSLNPDHNFYSIGLNAYGL